MTSADSTVKSTGISGTGTAWAGTSKMAWQLVQTR